MAVAAAAAAAVAAAALDGDDSIRRLCPHVKSLGFKVDEQDQNSQKEDTGNKACAKRGDDTSDQARPSPTITSRLVVLIKKGADGERM